MSYQHLRTLAERLYQRCPPWDARVVALGDQSAVVIDTSPFTKSLYLLDGRSWWALHAVVFDDTPIAGGQRTPTSLRVAEIDRLVQQIVDGMVAVYRDALAGDVGGVLEESMHWAAVQCLPHLTGENPTDAGSDGGAPRNTRSPALTPEQAAAVLGVPLAATRSEVMAAFRVRARLLHPDRLASAPEADQGVASIAMQQLNEALAVMRAVVGTGRGNGPTPPVSSARGEEPNVDPRQGAPREDRPEDQASGPLPGGSTTSYVARVRRPRKVHAIALSFVGLVVVALAVGWGVSAATEDPPAADATTAGETGGDLAGTCWAEDGVGMFVERSCSSSTAEHVVTISVASAAGCGARDWLGPTYDGGAYGERYWCLAPLDGDLAAAPAAPTPVTPRPAVEVRGPSGSWPQPFDDSDVPRVELEVHGKVTGQDAQLVVDVLHQRGIAINKGDYEDAFAWFSAEYLARRATTLESFSAPLRNAYWQGFEVTKIEEHPSGDIIADVTLYRHTVNNGTDSCELQYKTYTFDVDWASTTAMENLVAVDWITDYAEPQPC